MKKLSLLSVTSLGLALTATTAFAADDLKFPTAESALKNACEEAVSLAERDVQTVMEMSKKQAEIGPQEKDHQKAFSRTAAKHVVSAIGDIERLRNSLRRTMLPISQSFELEINRLNTERIPFAVLLPARIEINQAYRPELIEAMIRGVKEAGFDALKSTSDNTIEIMKDGKKTGATIELIIEKTEGDPEQASVEYRVSTLSPSATKFSEIGEFVLTSRDLLHNDKFEIQIMDEERAVNLGVNEGSYGRAGIDTNDSKEVMETKLGARFEFVSSQPRSFDDRISAVVKNAKEVQDFCANPSPDPK